METDHNHGNVEVLKTGQSVFLGVFRAKHPAKTCPSDVHTFQVTIR